MVEWVDDWRKNPRIFFHESYESFLDMVWFIRESDDYTRQISKSLCYFLYCTDKDKILWFFTYRYNLIFWDDATKWWNIWYGIRPSERKKGFATKGLELLLAELKTKWISWVYISCDDDNAGSVKAIERNGWTSPQFTLRHGVKSRRYWIDLIKTNTTLNTKF